MKYLTTPKSQLSEDDLAKLIIRRDYQNNPSRMELALAASDFLSEKPVSERSKFWRRGKKRSQETIEGKKQIEELQRSGSNLDMQAEMMGQLEKYFPRLTYLDETLDPEDTIDIASYLRNA